MTPATSPRKERELKRRVAKKVVATSRELLRMNRRERRAYGFTTNDRKRTEATLLEAELWL